MAMQEAVAHIKVDDSLLDYALDIVNRTRATDQLALGVSPRGTLMLQRAAQARAYLDGRDFCLPDDFKKLAVAVFAHRGWLARGTRRRRRNRRVPSRCCGKLWSRCQFLCDLEFGALLGGYDRERLQKADPSPCSG